MVEKLVTEDVVMGGSRFIVSFTVRLEHYGGVCSGCRGKLVAYRPILTLRRLMEIRNGVQAAYTGPWSERAMAEARAMYLGREGSACGVTQFCDGCTDSDRAAK